MKDYKALAKRLRAFSAAAIVKEAADAIDHLRRKLDHAEKVRLQQAETIMDLRKRLEADRSNKEVNDA